MWVLHLDVPGGVTVESRDEVYYEPLCGAPAEPVRTSTGKVSMPVFRSLTPAGVPQVKLGTDLGQRRTRLNVAIYNAGAVASAVTIDVRNACDGALVDSRTVTIPANTILQVGGLNGIGPECTSDDAPPWMRYTVITADQPSFSYVSSVSEDVPPVRVVPPIGLAVSIGTDY